MSSNDENEDLSEHSSTTEDSQHHRLLIGCLTPPRFSNGLNIASYKTSVSDNPFSRLRPSLDLKNHEGVYLKEEEHRFSYSPGRAQKAKIEASLLTLTSISTAITTTLDKFQFNSAQK